MMNTQKCQHEANYSLNEQLTELICPRTWYYSPLNLMGACLPTNEREVSCPTNTGGQNHAQLMHWGQGSWQAANYSQKLPHSNSAMCLHSGLWSISSSRHHKAFPLINNRQWLITQGGYLQLRLVLFIGS